MSARKNYTVRLNAAEAATIKTEADRAGVSVGEHIRRLALNRPAPIATVGAALDPALLDRLAALIAKGEADTTASAGAVEELRKTGVAFRGLLDRMAASTARPAVAPAPARPAARTDGLDEVRLSSSTR